MRKSISEEIKVPEEYRERVADIVAGNLEAKRLNGMRPERRLWSWNTLWALLSAGIVALAVGTVVYVLVH
jgi:hypothetical protein